MKKFIILLFLVFAALSAKPQLSFYGGYNTLLSSYPTMNKFLDSYNTSQASTLSKSPGHFGMMNGYNAGIIWSMSVFYFDIGFSQIFSGQKAEFNTGDSRHFKLKFNYENVGIGFGKQTEKFGIWAVGNLIFGDIYMRTYYEYKDGSRDIGPSHQLNGNYVGIVAMKQSYGIKAQVPIAKNLNVLVYLGYLTGYNLCWKKDNLHFYLSDINYPKMTYDQMYEIPTDYVKYWELGGTSSAYHGYTSDKNSYVGCDLGGLNLSIGVKWDIPGTKIE